MIFKKLIVLFFLIQSMHFFAQAESSVLQDAWVYLRYKPQSDYYLNNPLLFLSERSIERRNRQNIAVDFVDVPIHISYIDSISNSNVVVLAKSKWLNALHIQGTEANVNALLNIDFVSRVEFANRDLNVNARLSHMDDSINSSLKFEFENFRTTENFNYGNASIQNNMLNISYLHNNNFTGTNMEIAVIDAGFPNVNTIGAFNRIRANNQIGTTHNYVTNSSNVYTGNWHGTSVLSTICAYIENQYVGTAPNAKFHLFVTEADAYEGPLEQSWWVEALEKADSLGVDVVNSSLGYRTFDNSLYNYTPSDMNGQISFISRGANFAISRGMIVVNSNGNYRGSNWNIMGTPADNENVFSVGAVNSNRIIGSFSSPGPTADGRIKPDVVAMGDAAKVVYIDNRIYSLNGTSFASPIMAGSIACFWEAFPNKTATEILNIVKQSSHLYANPNFDMGYGIPNFQIAYEQTLSFNKQNVNKILVLPNPTSSTIQIVLPNNSFESEFILYNNFGQILIKTGINQNQLLNLESLSKGVYLYNIKNDNEIFSGKIIKK